MDIFVVLSSMMVTSVKARFKHLVDTKKIDLKDFGNEETYHTAARKCLAGMSNSLINAGEDPQVYLDIAVYSYLLYSIESETPGELIQNSLEGSVVEPEAEAVVQKTNPLGSGESVAGAWGATPVSLADADNALREDENHIKEQSRGSRQQAIGMYTADGIGMYTTEGSQPVGQFDQE